MKKIEDISKESIFKVPEGYFDKLPGVIQSRVASQKKSAFSFSWNVALRYALPAIVVIIAGIYWFRPAPGLDEQLNSIPAEQIAFYLDDLDLHDDEVQDEEPWTVEEMDQLESDVYDQMDTSEDFEQEMMDALDSDNI